MFDWPVVPLCDAQLQDVLVESGINFYVTFTGMPEASVEDFKQAVRKRY